MWEQASKYPLQFAVLKWLAEDGAVAEVIPHVVGAVARGDGKRHAMSLESLSHHPAAGPIQVHIQQRGVECLPIHQIDGAVSGGGKDHGLAAEICEYVLNH